MDNIINSQNININNSIPSISFERKKKNDPVKAADYLYKYSVSEALKDKFEFRKNIERNTKNTLEPKQRKPFKAILIISAILSAIVFAFEHKK